MRLTTNFTFEEMIASDVAKRHGIRNFPPQELVPNLRRVAKLLEQVRELLGGEPIYVNSGYRSAELNRAVNGSKTSAHMQGLAADFRTKQYKPLQIAEKIAASDIDYDQLIVEFSEWVHIGLAAPGVISRRENLHIVYGSGFRKGLN